MCPICMTTVALVAAGTGSLGGLAALGVTLRARRRKARVEKEDERPGETPDSKEEAR